MWTELLIGVVGGFIGAMGGLAVQHLENKAAARERREARLAEAISEFVTAATAWSEWIRTGYTNRRLTVEEVLDENNERSRDRQAAYRKLQVHCSKQTFEWLKKHYKPVEYEVKKSAGGPLVGQLVEIIAKFGDPDANGTPVPADHPPVMTKEADAALDDYEELVDGKLMDRCRTEIDALSRTEGLFKRKTDAASRPQK